MNWNDRVLEAHDRMSVEDWEDELDRALPTTRKNVYEGDLGMDERTADRIATALEQIALELADRNGMKPPQTVKPITEFPGFEEREPKLMPERCPIHGTEWRVGRNGSYYCPRKMQDGSWCRQKPTLAPQYAALP